MELSLVECMVLIEFHAKHSFADPERIAQLAEQAKIAKRREAAGPKPVAA